MRNIFYDYASDLLDYQRIAISIAKGTAARAARRVDLTAPGSWEFSGFSQNGEDGLLDVLRSALLRPSRDFLEIGSADGVQNNTSWLFVTEQYHGVMVEGSRSLSAKCRRMLGRFGIGADFISCFVTRENARELIGRCESLAPDVFSLDIDGNDYHVACALLEAGLRPKIVVLEYNSVFGPERSVTIPYDPQFSYRQAHPSHLYYGVSLRGWQTLLGGAGYRFVTVDRNGVNCVFVDPGQFDPAFLQGIVPHSWAENAYQVRASGRRGEAQYALIESLPTIAI